LRDASYHAIDAAPTEPVAEVLTLQTALNRAHPAGSTIVERAPLFDVEALDAGGWGNRLRISVEDEPAGLVSRTQLAQIIDPGTIRLQSATGVQAGTLLEFFDQATNGVIGPPIKVNSHNQAANFTNPYPVNINVIRDFRDNNRGIRVYGGRVISPSSTAISIILSSSATSGMALTRRRRTIRTDA
jgi:hypothetical protein